MTQSGHSKVESGAIGARFMSQSVIA
jgi:hypothetical protein